MQGKKSALIWLWLTTVIIILDQASKYYIDQHFMLYQPYAIFSWLNLTLAYNSGAAFSFLRDAGGWQLYLFSAISLLVSLIILVWMSRVPRKDVLLGLSLSLILGGALGNVIDRIRLGYVIDFVDFHIKNWHFDTFNLADSAITVGAILLIIQLVFFSKK